MLKIISLVITFFILMEASAKPQQPQTSSAIPSYVILPQIPNNLTPPPPGQPSSFNIGQIRNRRAAANNTAFSSSSSSFSSATSSEENQSRTNKAGSNKSTINSKTQLRDEPKLIDSGRAKIEAYSAPLAQLDLPGMNPPATHRYLMNETSTDALKGTSTPMTTTLTSNDAQNTTQSIGH